MAKIRVGIGVEFPNAMNEWKSDGTGQTGLADGWTAEAQADTDLTFNRRSIQFGYGASSTKAGAHILGSGHALKVTFPTGLGTASRKLFTPRSPAGQFFGSEQMNFDGRGFWLYRLLVLARLGSGLQATGTKFGVRVYNAARDRTKDFLSISPGASEMDNTWRLFETTALLNDTGWVGAGSSDLPDHAEAFVNANFNVTGSTDDIWVQGFWLETLGPVDVGSGSDTLHEGGQTTFYELSHDPSFRPGPLRPPVYVNFGRSRRLPSGQLRRFDPSAGVRRREWELPHALLTRGDWERLWLLWSANRGYPGNEGSTFGSPLPLVLRSQLPDDPFPHYVDFEGEEFPLDRYGQGFLPTGEANQRYQGTLRFLER